MYIIGKGIAIKVGLWNYLQKGNQQDLHLRTYIYNISVRNLTKLCFSGQMPL